MNNALKKDVLFINIDSRFLEKELEKIKDNDTIDGFDGDEISEEVRWVCRYEDSMAQPMRPVIDINPGKYSAGNRE